MTQVKEISLRQFALSIGFSPSGAKSWLAIPEFRNCLREVHKGRVVRYYVTDPEAAKEALKQAGYVLPEEA